MSEMYWIVAACWEGPCKGSVKCTLSFSIKFRPLEIDSLLMPTFQTYFTTSKHISLIYTFYSYDIGSAFKENFITILGPK